MSRPSAAELDRMVDFINSLNVLETRFSELVSQLRGLTINNVLFSGVIKLDADGVGTVSSTVPFAAASIGNLGNATLTVTNGGRESDAPTEGPGMHLVSPGGDAVINLVGRQLAIYGDAGDRINVQLFDKPQGPASSGGGPDAELDAYLSDGPVAVAASAASVVLAPANADRQGGLIYNDSTADLYITFGPVSSAALFTMMLGPGDAYDLGNGRSYRGVISGIWTAATGNALITEVA